MYPQPYWHARGSEAAELDILLDPALAAFDGHFPQAAILPGVAQLDWAIHFGREAFAIEAPFQPEHGAYGGGHHHSHHGEAEFNYAPRLHQFGVRR